MTKKITKDTTLEEILNMPGAEKILIENNIPCLSCPFASQEVPYLKLGEISKMYNINLKKVLEELNKNLK